jgi:hypothetical protein
MRPGESFRPLVSLDITQRTLPLPPSISHPLSPFVGWVHSNFHRARLGGGGGGGGGHFRHHARLIAFINII